MDKSNMLTCKFCQKECKNDNSFRNHERICPKNSNRVYKNGMTGKTGNNQFTKAKRLDKEPPKVSNETKEKIRASNKKRTKEWNKENGKKISDSIKRKVIEGTWHTSLAKNMHIDYKGNDLHGSWELKYAKYLDQRNVTWIRNVKQFPYIYDGKERMYTPDFYLVETDEYIEIKGFATEKDIAKWKCFPVNKKLTILMKKELENLGIL